jgi:hypothetical protein
MDALVEIHRALTGQERAPPLTDAPALLAQLREVGAVAWLDWRGEPSEAASRLVALAVRAGVPAEKARALLAIDDDELDSFLGRAAELLAGSSATLIDLGTDGDEYHLAILPADRARALVTHAKKVAGLAPRVVGASATKRRTTKAKTSRAKPSRAPDASRDAMMRAVEVLTATRAESVTARAPHPMLPPSLGETSLCVMIGSALAAAGEPADAWRAPWAGAGACVAAQLGSQASRFGYVLLGLDRFQAVCAAWLASAEGPIFELLASHPRKQEDGAAPRYSFMSRMHEVFGAGIVLSAAEERDLALYADLVAYGALLGAADAPDDRFARCLIDWLEVDWAKTDRAMSKNRDPRWPYPGPISAVACALVARRATTPRLPDDLARFVPAAVVDAARGWRGSRSP